MGVMIIRIVSGNQSCTNIADPVKKKRLERKGTMLFGLSLTGLMSVMLWRIFPFGFIRFSIAASRIFQVLFSESYIQPAMARFRPIL
jgi:hypothetical protein